jgi:hypothetical protein
MWLGKNLRDVYNRQGISSLVTLDMQESTDITYCFLTLKLSEDSRSFYQLATLR